MRVFQLCYNKVEGNFTFSSSGHHIHMTSSVHRGYGSSVLLPEEIHLILSFLGTDTCSGTAVKGFAASTPDPHLGHIPLYAASPPRLSALSPCLHTHCQPKCGLVTLCSSWDYSRPRPLDLMEESWTKPGHGVFMVGLRTLICVGDS